MLSTMKLIALVGFFLFIGAASSLIIFVAGGASMNLKVAAVLAMAITLGVTLHAKNEVRDLTPPAPPTRKVFTAGQEEEAEYTELQARQRDRTHHGGLLTPDDSDFSGE